MRNVLPAIKAGLAGKLIENHGMSQKEAANTLVVSAAAINHALSVDLPRHWNPLQARTLDRLSLKEQVLRYR